MRENEKSCEYSKVTYKCILYRLCLFAIQNSMDVESTSNVRAGILSLTITQGSEARHPQGLCATLGSYTTYMVSISNGSGYGADRELGALYTPSL